MARRASLLFAQSGAGKSSLLRAGLIPELTEPRTIGRGPRPRTYQKMRVLPIASVGNPGSTPARGRPPANVYVLSALLSLRPDTPTEKLASLALVDGLTPLLAPPADPAVETPADALLVFDQFEELFTTSPEHWTQREGFFRQVAALLDAYPDLHVLFSICQDYIAELTPYTPILPRELAGPVPA